MHDKQNGTRHAADGVPTLLAIHGAILPKNYGGIGEYPRGRLEIEAAVLPLV